MKKGIIIACAAVVIVIAVCACLLFSAFKEIPCVKSIGLKSDASGNTVISFKQAGSSGYIVTPLKEGEHVYLTEGERTTEYADSLGEYCVMIKLCDTKVSADFQEKYADGETHTLSTGDQEIKFMWCYNADHGITCYVGTNGNFTTEETDYTKFSSPFETAKIVFEKKD